MHWWYRGRQRILLQALDALALAPRARVLDAGCGAGTLMEELDRAGAVVSGVEADPRAAELARTLGAGDVLVGDVSDLPYADATFDLVTCLDVLEHVKDDVAALRELRRVTAPHGRLLVAVPNHPWLWSGHDRAAGHVRRYTPRRLLAVAGAAGWTPLAHTTFNIVLLPAMAAARLAGRRRHVPPRSSLLATPRALDVLLEMPLRAEAAALARGHRLPAGLSILATLRPAS